MKYTLLGACFFCAVNVAAQDSGKGDVKFGMELTSELQGTHKGGHRPATSGNASQSYNYANLLRLNVSVPVTRSVRFEAASLSTCMTAEESIGGELQTCSNLDAGNIPFALSVCGMSWTYPSRQKGTTHSLSLGIRNMNEDYFCSPATSLFTNSSCGIYPTISINYPIANYPVASVGMHYRYENEKLCYKNKDKNKDNNKNKDEDVNENGSFVLQASLYNGQGYHRFTGRDNIFRVCPKDDGVFGLTEVSYTRRGSYYSLGNAIYYKESMSATPWFYTEQSITPRLTLLAGYSHAFAADAQCRDFLGCGVLYQLGQCQLGAFTDYANFLERNEFATELTCKIPLSQHIDIQPTAHLIAHDGRLHCVAMLRMALSY